MLLYLIRHGETEYNLQGRIQGQIDTPLTALGRKQAKSAARRVKHVQFDALYSSDLGRAIETANEVSKTIGLEINRSTLLRERNFGVLQGLTREEAASKFPEAANEWRKADPAARIPEGESTLDVIARCNEFIQFLAANHPENSTICAVCHGGSLRGLVLAMTKIPPELGRVFLFANASLSILEIGKKTSIKLLNDTHHAESLEVTERDEDNA